MSQKTIKELLAQLQDELENTEEIDAETRQLVRELDEDIHRLVDPESDLNDSEGILDQANAIETRFAVDHPRAERFLRELMEALSKVGI